MPKLNKAEIHFCWMVYGIAEDDPDQKPRLLIPMVSDEHGNEGAQPYDLLHTSVREAYEALRKTGCAEQAKDENWVLCMRSLVPITVLDPALIPLE